MKLLADARTLGDKPSGIGIYLYNFIRELKMEPDLEIELVTDVVKSSELLGLREEGVPVYAYGKQVKKSAGVYPYFRFVQKQIYSRKPDLFWEVNNLIPVKLKNPYGKIAVTIHDLFPISDPDCFPGYYCVYFKHGVRKTLKNADMVIYNTGTVKKSVEAYDRRAAALPNFVSYLIIDHMPKLPIEDRGYFLYIGNLERRKGADLLLRAYRKYRNEGGTMSLHLGGAVREEEIQTLLDECSAQFPELEYLGYISEEQKWREYAGCAAFVFPSRAEGFGVPVIEAVSYQKPVILSRLAVFEETAGKELTYITLWKEEEKTVAELSAAMLHFEKADGERQLKDEFCSGIIERYSAKKLAGKLSSFFRETS